MANILSKIWSHLTNLPCIKCGTFQADVEVSDSEGLFEALPDHSYAKPAILDSEITDPSRNKSDLFLNANIYVWPATLFQD